MAGTGTPDDMTGRPEGASLPVVPDGEGRAREHLRDAVRRLTPARSRTPVRAPVAAAPSRRAAGVRTFAAAVEAALDERRAFVLVPFAVMVGVALNRWAEAEPAPSAVLLVGLVLLGAFLSLRRAGRLLHMPMLALAVWSGFALLSLHGALFGTPMLSENVYGQYTARVDQIIADDGTELRLVISAITPVAGAPEVPMRRARVIVPAEMLPAVGDTMEARFRFYPVPGPVVPGGYDGQFHGYFAGIGAFGSAGRELVYTPPEDTGDFQRWLMDLRAAIGARFDMAMSAERAAVARALVIGDQSRIDDDMWRHLGISGLAHILSVSGLHLSLVAGGVFAGVRLGLAASYAGAQRLPIKKIAAVIGVLTAVAYLMISGVSVAAVRATIMLILVFGAILVGRRALTMRNIAFAALIVLASDPTGFYRPGFQLSFAAVVALIGAYELSRGRHRPAEGWAAGLWRWVLGLAATSLVAGGATALFAGYHFQNTAPLGIIANMLAVPLAGFLVLPAALLAVLAMPLGFERPFLEAFGWGSDQMVAISAMVAGWTGDIPTAPLLTPLSLVIGTIAIAWFAFLDGRWRLAGPAAGLALIALLAIDRSPDVLVADTTRGVAVRAENGLALIAGQATSFAVRAWSDTYQERIAAAADDLRCDPLGCVLASPRGFTVALVLRPQAFAEDCLMADLVVTRLVAPPECRVHAAVVDAADLMRGGVHWLRWRGEGDGFEIRAAIGEQTRPWRIGAGIIP